MKVVVSTPVHSALPNKEAAAAAAVVTGRRAVTGEKGFRPRHKRGKPHTSPLKEMKEEEKGGRR